MCPYREWASLSWNLCWLALYTSARVTREERESGQVEVSADEGDPSLRKRVYETWRHLVPERGTVALVGRVLLTAGAAAQYTSSRRDLKKGNRQVSVSAKIDGFGPGSDQIH